MNNPTFNETHAELVARLSKLGVDIIRDLTPAKAHLWHMGTGITGDAGGAWVGIIAVVAGSCPAWVVGGGATTN